MIDASVILLAGGRNSRMNYQNKSLLKIGNEKLIERILMEVDHFKQVLICANDPKPYLYLGVEIVKDIFPDLGPLSGIHAGLLESQCSHSLVIAADMPFLRRDLLEYLASLYCDYDVVIPRAGEFYQPLCAVYAKACLPYIEANLKNNIRKTTSFYKELKVKYVNEDELEEFGEFEHIFRNINTPEDYNLYCNP